MKTISIIFTLLFLHPLQVSASDHIQMTGVIHVHSTYSSGGETIAELVTKANQAKIGALVLTDHDRVVMEYGFPPFRNIVKKRVERPSVLRKGIENYLAEIHHQNQIQNDVIVIPGVQSSPFYYWAGNPFEGDLTAHDFSKEILAIGMMDPSDYKRLPFPHNGLHFQFHRNRLLPFLASIALLLIGVWLIHKLTRKKWGVAVCIIAICFLFDRNPFVGSNHDPYYGPRDTDPYQEFIDYVQSRGGMTFWSHPESRFSAEGQDLGLIRLVTKPYPGDMVQTANYTGFAALYGETTLADAPGMQWDVMLNQYCEGTRKTPVWAIAESDYHGLDGKEPLDRYLTVFLVREKTREAVLDAMKHGHMYAISRSGPVSPVLDYFRVTDGEDGNNAISGEQFTVRALPPKLSGKISVSDGQQYVAEVKIIRNGELYKYFMDYTPIEFTFTETEYPARGKNNYRIDARIEKIGRILSNPVFVSKS